MIAGDLKLSALWMESCIENDWDLGVVLACSAYYSARDTFLPAFESVFNEAYLLGEGLVHIAQAPDDVRHDFTRDSLTCATETGLAIAEDVAFEVTLGVAAIETGERLINTPVEKIDMRETAYGFIESLTSSAAVAFHAARDMVSDLEKSGSSWLRNHGKSETGLPLAPVSSISSAASASPTGIK